MNAAKPIFLVLIPGFPSSESDTTCLPFQQAFVRSLQVHAPEFNVVVVSFQYPYHQRKYHWNGIPVIPFGGKNRGGFSRLLLRRKIFSTIRNLQKENEIAGILSFWYGECALVGKRFANRNNIKHFCWICGQDARKNNPYPARVKARANELIALSDSLQHEFNKNYCLKPAHVIEPGLSAVEEKNHERRIDIMGAGSFIPLKRYELFLEVVAKLKNNFPGIRVVLAGDGPEKQNLQLLIKKYSLETNVELTGELAMDHEIMNWEVVGSATGMYQAALKMLCDNSIEFNPVKTYTLERTTAKILSLYRDDPA
jgi:glycosyltransferase involved in cell wall biosynthesis